MTALRGACHMCLYRQSVEGCTRCPSCMPADTLNEWVRARMIAFIEGAELLREESDDDTKLWTEEDMAEWMTPDLFEDDNDETRVKTLAICDGAGWPSSCQEPTS